MDINRYHLLFVIAAIVLTSCSPTSNIQTPNPGPLVPTGQVETIELGTTVENVWNCGTGGGTIVKHPLRSVSTNHSVEWEVGGTSGVGVTIGEGAIPGGVDISQSLEGHYRSQFDTGSQQSTSWDLPAEPNTTVDYTLIWRETWETGYIDVVYPDNTNKRINLRYRTNIGSEMVGKQVKSCNESQPNPAQPNPVQPTQVPQPTVQSRPTNTLSRAEIDAILGEGNWFCFPDRETGLAVKRIQPGFLVQSPIRLVNTYQGNFTLGQAVPQIGATIELEKLLLQSECPYTQQDALLDWIKSRATDSQPFDRTRINDLLSAGIWKCLSEFPYAVTVPQLKSDLVIQYPITFVTYYDSTNHSVGETVPKGQAVTVWLGGSIPTNQCP